MSESSTMVAYPRLRVPALRAHMGDWVYYIGFLRLRDLAERVRTAAEIHRSERLREMIQRVLQGKRTNQIAEYLLREQQRFFNAIVIGVYGGEPRYFEFDVSPRVEDEGGEDEDEEEKGEVLPAYADGAVGFLELSGHEKLFALDGQHRLVGVKTALASDAGQDMAEEEVAVIFVAHRETDDGRARTRRLFSSLNKNAKPVSKREIIALDEDDIIAILTRDLVDEYPLFVGKKTSQKNTSSLHRTDPFSFTTVETLFDVLNIILRDRPARKWGDFRGSRPPEKVISDYRARAEQFFDELQKAVPELGELAAANDVDAVPGRYRTDEGGHLLFRPIGLTRVVTAIRTLQDQGAELTEAVKRVTAAPMDLADPLWTGVLWDPVNARMIPAGENQRAALWVLIHGAGGRLGPKVGPADLRRQLAGLKNLPEDAVELPSFGDDPAAVDPKE